MYSSLVKVVGFVSLAFIFTPVVMATGKETSTITINKSVHVPAQDSPYVKVFAKVIPAPTSLNVSGMTGSITFTSTLPYIAQSAVAIWSSPNGTCPDEQTVFTEYQTILTNFPGSKNINFINLILSKPGSVTVPVTHQFSVKRPLTGCIFVTFDMAAAPDGTTSSGGITTTTNISLTYDTLTPPSPAPFAIPIGTEYCFGTTQGCAKATTCTNISCAFATMYKVTSPLTLTDLFGDVTASPLNSPMYGTAPTSTWSAATDFYVYNTCDNLPNRVNGPDNYYAQIPGDATPLLHVPINSTSDNSVNTAVSKKFAPIKLEKGNCLIGLTKFFSPNGAVTVNAQVYALLQARNTTKPGDLDGNGNVDLFDYNILISKFGNPYTLIDFNTLLRNYGT